MSLPGGECIVTRLARGPQPEVTVALSTGAGGGATVTGPLRVDRADPRILIAGPLVRLWHGGSPELPALIKICGVNQALIYRIDRYHPGRDVYEAEFPD